MNIFEDSFYSGFFGALMKDLQIAEREKRLKDAGVEIIDGVYGIPSKDIPFKFKKIIVSKDLIYCFIDEEFFAYDISGMFLFKAIKVEKIGDNFYLVQHKKDGGWALFKGNMKLTKPIFRYNIRARFEKDFSIIGLQKNFMDDVVINKKGKIIYEIQEHFSYPILYGNIFVGDGKIINLHTGEKICDKGHSSILETNDEIFVEIHKQVFKINKTTCKYEVFGESDEPPRPQPKTTETLPKTKVPKATKPNPPKQNRNDLCACGSGKKYKNCCGRK